jgi:hypothetical protein
VVKTGWLERTERAGLRAIGQDNRKQYRVLSKKGRRMSDFVLIDLYSQRDQVKAYLEGVSIQESLNWMNKYGTVKKITSPHDENLYSFQSSQGTQTAFRFDEGGKLVIFHLW